MSEATGVEARLDKLEQDNRRLKLTVGALLLALAAVPLIGAVMPQQEVQDVIRARAFYVEDANGNISASMSDNGFVYSDQNGTLRASMDDIGIFHYDENGDMEWSTFRR